MLASSGNSINLRPQGLSLIRKYIYYVAVKKFTIGAKVWLFRKFVFFLRLATVPLQRLLYCKSDMVREGAPVIEENRNKLACSNQINK